MDRHRSTELDLFLKLMIWIWYEAEYAYFSLILFK